MLPLQVVPTSEPVTDVMVRFACAVQLSLAADPLRARNWAMVVTGAGKSELHSRSTVVGAVAVGFVLSVTVKT